MKLKISAYIANPAIELDEGAWDRHTQKEHAKEEYGIAKKVKNQLSEYFHNLLRELGLSNEVKKGLEEVFHSTNKDVRLKGNKLRQALQDFLKKVPAPDKQFFQNVYGSNVTDWLTNKVIASYDERNCR
jgi:hypothetical protein